MLRSFEPAFAGGLQPRSSALAKAYRVAAVGWGALLISVGSKPEVQQGELLGLTWKNVDFERCEIGVAQQLSRQEQKGQRLVLGSLKTKYSRRTIEIGDDLVELLKAYRLSQQKDKQLMGTSWKEHDLVITSSVGTRLDQRNVQRDFDNLLKSAGLPKLRFHDLRHNAASLMLRRKVPVVTVSRYLGHSSPRVTLDVYAHLIPGGFDEVAQAMSAIPVGVDAE